MKLIGEVIRVEDEGEYLKDAFRIALHEGITIYDSLYIAQAMKHKAKLLTSDKGQAKVAQSLGLKVILL